MTTAQLAIAGNAATLGAMLDDMAASYLAGEGTDIGSVGKQITATYLGTKEKTETVTEMVPRLQRGRIAEIGVRPALFGIGGVRAGGIARRIIGPSFIGWRNA